MSGWSRKAANMRGVSPLAVARLGFAPAPSSSRAASARPYHTAQLSAESPFGVTGTNRDAEKKSQLKNIKKNYFKSNENRHN